MDFFTVNFKDVNEPEYYYTEKEEIADDSKVRGDINVDGICDVADLVLMQKWLLGSTDEIPEDLAAGDLCEDGVIDSYDMCLMRKLIVENKG